MARASISLVLVCVAAAGCGRADDRAAIRSVVGDKPIESISVDVENAEVRFADGTRAFLGHNDRGWEISASGCRPESSPEHPMKCEVER